MESQATERPNFDISDQWVGINDNSICILLKRVQWGVEPSVDSKIKEILETRGPLCTKLRPAYFRFDIFLVAAEVML